MGMVKSFREWSVMAYFESVIIPGFSLLYGFLSLFLLSKGKPTRRDIYAVGLLFVLLLPVLQNELIDVIKPKLGNYQYLRELVPLLVSPFLFFYTKALIKPHADKKGEIVLHLLPFLLALLLLVSPFLHQYHPTDNIFATLRRNAPLPNRPPFLLIISIMGSASVFIYSWRLFTLLNYRKVALEENFSFMSADLRLFWVQELIFGLGAVQVYLLIATVAAVSGFRHPFLNPSKALDIGYCFYFLFFAYFCLRQDRILFTYDLSTNAAHSDAALSESVSDGDPGLSTVVPLEHSESAETPKYKKSGLDEKQLKRVLDKVSQLMEEEKLFRRGDLTLEHISLRTGISRHYISQALNEIAGKHFYAWVNLYRAHDVRTSLENPSLNTLSVLELSSRSGFNSKSSFISYFKQLTGQTPSQYRKNYNCESPGSSLSGETTNTSGRGIIELEKH